MKKTELAVIIGAVVTAILLGIAQFTQQAIPTGSWGLHFESQGSPPSGPASVKQLQQYDAYFLGDTEEKVLYLTFDAGYENGYTEKILDTLAKHEVKAAFFLVGDYLERNADLVRRMVDEGHIVGNHTATHPDMSKYTDPDAFATELTQVENMFREITGKELPKFYRPPQGVYSEENLKLAQALGYQTIFWSLAYADWNNDSQPSQEYALGKLLPRTHNGAIILLHATSKTNAEVLDTLLTRWKAQGYRFASLDMLN